MGLIQTLCPFLFTRRGLKSRRATLVTSQHLHHTTQMLLRAAVLALFHPPLPMLYQHLFYKHMHPTRCFCKIFWKSVLSSLHFSEEKRKGLELYATFASLGSVQKETLITRGLAEGCLCVKAEIVFLNLTDKGPVAFLTLCLMIIVFRKSHIYTYFENNCLYLNIKMMLFLASRSLRLMKKYNLPIYPLQPFQLRKS